MPVYCLPDNTTCSYCVSNLNRPDVSCITLNSHYTESISIELDYEQLVSVRVEACKDIFPEYCLQRSEWTNYTIPPGGKLQLKPRARGSVHTSANLILYFSNKNGKRKYYLSLSYLHILKYRKKQKKRKWSGKLIIFSFS